MKLWKTLCGAALAALIGAAPVSAEETLRLRMNGDINTLDPIATTNFTIRNAAYLMYDTLFALDSNYEPQPQMAEGYTLSDDELTYTITLRDGLKFHDGSDVTAEDVVASIKRWGKADSLGKTLFTKVDSLTAADDKTVVLKMTSPWGQVIPALAKVSSNIPVIMPAEMAARDASDPIAIPMGSGPYMLVPDEWVPGSIAVFKKFEDYVPRSEPADMAAGGKVAHFDRVELVYIPDTMTAVDALIAGEIDWMEEVPSDLLALFEDVDSAKTIAARQSGNSLQLVVNHLNPPFDNVKIRQALQLSLEQMPFLLAQYGSNPDLYLECAAVFFCDSPYESNANTDRILKRDVAKAKEMLKEAGYDGTPVFIMHVTDIPAQDASYSVLKPMLEEVGFVVKEQMADWATVGSRRASREPVDKGGWNVFFTGWGFVDQSNPMTNVYVAGACDDGWFGWACSEELQELRRKFADAQTQEERKQLAERMQIVTHDLVSYVPLGQSFPSQGIATNLEGYIESPVPFFWNLKRK